MKFVALQNFILILKSIWVFSGLRTCWTCRSFFILLSFFRADHFSKYVHKYNRNCF